MDKKYIEERIQKMLNNIKEEENKIEQYKIYGDKKGMKISKEMINKYNSCIDRYKEEMGV